MSDKINEIKLKIKSLFNQELPGRESQLDMVAVPRKVIDIPTPPDAKKAAVLILLYVKDNNLHTVFMKRALHNGDQHSGQISLPGGKNEDSDIDLSFTALRETEEEIGIKESSIELLGQLTTMYIPVSGFEVTPFVGMINTEPEFILDTIESQYLIEAPITQLLDPKTKKFTSIQHRAGFFLKEVPYFSIDDHVIWGATAMMLNEFLDMIRADHHTIL